MEQNGSVNRKRHHGRNIQYFRGIKGIKQDALASEINISQSQLSQLEHQEEINDELLDKVSQALQIDLDLIKGFDPEGAIFNINNNSFTENTFQEGSTAIAQQFNPIEKIIELYERLLRSEQEKLELLKTRNETH
jgi:transcriptional regulator with XRE-family HTH domain